MSLSGKPSAPARADKFIEAVVADKRSRLNVELPKTLHRDFKAKCAIEETEMREVIEEAIRRYLVGTFKIERRRGGK